MSSPFRVAVISDEITQDFEKACEIVSREFGLQWIELRGMWNKNILHLDAKEIGEARRILERYHLRVTDIASPLFKVDWPCAPKSRFSPKRDQFNADFTFDQQDEVLQLNLAIAYSKNNQMDQARDILSSIVKEQPPSQAIAKPAVNYNLSARPRGSCELK